MTKVNLVDVDNRCRYYNDIGSNRISLKQNASGFWYVNELTINCISIIDGIELSKVAMDKVVGFLNKENNKVKK